MASISAALNEGQWPKVKSDQRGKYTRPEDSRDLVTKASNYMNYTTILVMENI